MTRTEEIKASWKKDKNGKIYAPFETNYLVPELLELVIAQNEALEGVRMHKCMFDTDADFNKSCDSVNAAIAQLKAWNEVV